MLIEHRVRLFHDLNKNKWFHIMNYCLDVMKMTDPAQRFMLIKYGRPFYI